MSPDFTYASIGTSIILAPASQVCHAQLCSHRIDIGVSLLADNEGDEDAHTGWIPELNRHRG